MEKRIIDLQVDKLVNFYTIESKKDDIDVSLKLEMDDKQIREAYKTFRDIVLKMDDEEEKKE